MWRGDLRSLISRVESEREREKKRNRWYKHDCIFCFFFKCDRIYEYSGRGIIEMNFKIGLCKSKI